MFLDFKVRPIAFYPSILSVSNWTSIVAKEILVGGQVSGPWISMSTGSSWPGGMANTWMAWRWGEITDAMDRDDAKALLAGEPEKVRKNVLGVRPVCWHRLILNLDLLPIE